MTRRGFTIIELLIVLTIIAVLATLAVPRLVNTKERAQIAAMKSDLRNLVTLEENYLAENLKYATALGGAYTVSAGNRPPTITLTGDGWTAVMTSGNTDQQCAVFVGSTPVRPATREGAPACEVAAPTATPTP